ncbi:hypothetical protein AVEN_274392-1 [Araneus ventricosus]|uniref:Uncharacterized protein n=1 Tax=Araneus ventricosus TaxID=182803 RepID=A0A4Y2DZT8_ARAVE|nr:hypothetical protein AVEN_260243-1 [Araneus ventricosus]GBM21596.1 hypothetical protein AVEN_274392-1 [Araneus ventricosus]
MYKSVEHAITCVDIPFSNLCTLETITNLGHPKFPYARDPPPHIYAMTMTTSTDSPIGFRVYKDGRDVSTPVTFQHLCPGSPNEVVRYREWLISKHFMVKLSITPLQFSSGFFY